jgi:hypothetical protein
LSLTEAQPLLSHDWEGPKVTGEFDDGYLHIDGASGDGARAGNGARPTHHDGTTAPGSMA